MATREERREIEYKSQNKIYKTITVKFRKDSGIAGALDAMKDGTGILIPNFIQDAVREKLISTGYNPENYK